MSDNQYPDYGLPPAAEEMEAADGGLLDWLRQQPPIYLGMVGVSLLAIIVLAVVLLWPRGDRGDGTPSPEATGTSQFAVPQADALLVDSGTPQPQVTIPISLTLKGLEFGVLPYQVKPDGVWEYPAGQSGAAVWVYGTIVNFVMGVEHNQGNVALMQSLTAGDEITMTTASGAIYRFGFADRDEWSASAGSDLFRQNQPGLTLVTLGGEDDTRLVVHANYLALVQGKETGRPLGPSFAVGEPAQLGDIRVTVLGTAYVFEDARVPPGWAFFLVDYQIENFSQQVLDPNRFRMELQDGSGAVHSINLPASQAGAFGYLMLTIPPNAVAQGTAGYLVPAPLPGPKLSWSFSRLDQPESVVKVLIDFAPAEPEVVDPRSLAAVQLSGAELSGDRTLLSVWGTVVNNSEEPLAVTLEDVALQGAEESIAPLRAADPALPWTVQPGSVLSFRLSFQRPNSPTATFTVLNRPFEISGLQ